MIPQAFASSYAPSRSTCGKAPTRSRERRRACESVVARTHSHLNYVSPIEFETNAPSWFKQSNLFARSGQLQMFNLRWERLCPRSQSGSCMLPGRDLPCLDLPDRGTAFVSHLSSRNAKGSPSPLSL